MTRIHDNSTYSSLVSDNWGNGDGLNIQAWSRVDIYYILCYDHCVTLTFAERNRLSFSLCGTSR